MALTNASSRPGPRASSRAATRAAAGERSSQLTRKFKVSRDRVHAYLNPEVTAAC